MQNHFYIVQSIPKHGLEGDMGQITITDMPAAIGAINICNSFMTEANVDFAVAAPSLRNILSVLAIGLFGSAFLYVLARWFEGILARRRTYWNYRKARFREEFSSTNGL